MFRNMRHDIHFDMLLSPSSKMTTCFANIARSTASTSNIIYQKDFKSFGSGS